MSEFCGFPDHLLSCRCLALQPGEESDWDRIKRLERELTEARAALEQEKAQCARLIACLRRITQIDANWHTSAARPRHVQMTDVALKLLADPSTASTAEWLRKRDEAIARNAWDEGQSAGLDDYYWVHVMHKKGSTSANPYAAGEPSEVKS